MSTPARLIDPQTGVATVGLRDLARHTRAVVDAVSERGEDRVVTDQGRPVALLTSYAPEPTQLPVAAFDALSEAAEATGDRRRYELIQGELSVSPSPNRNHQRAVGIFCHIITAATGGLGWRAQPGSDLRAATSVLCPDAMLIPENDDDALPTLVVEVTSTNRATDLGPKRDAYAAMGIPAYWVLDRHRGALVVFARGDDGTYGDGEVHEREALVTLSVTVAGTPVDVELVVADLLG